MFESFIRFLITVLLIGLCVFLAIWVAGIVGLVIPHQVVVILYAIAVLVCILIAWRFFGSALTGSWFPPAPPR